MCRNLAILGLLWFVLPSSLWAADAPTWLPKYRLEVDLYPEKQQVDVIQKVTWTNRSEKDLSQIVFNVHSRYVPPSDPIKKLFLAKMLEIMRIPAHEAIYTDIPFELELVTLDTNTESKPLKFSYYHDLPTALNVNLPAPLKVGETINLTLKYRLKLPQRQGRWGQWKDVVMLSNWHPVVAFHDNEKGWSPTPFVPWHQPFYNEAARYTVYLNIPADYKVACTGSPKTIKHQDDRKTVQIEDVVAREFSLVTSAKFAEYTEPAGDVTVRCLALPEHEHYAHILAKNAAKAIVGFSKWFGPYPYKDLYIAESYFGWNGNECSGMVMIDERVFAMPHFAEGYSEYLITHEVCHQWWYNVVGTDGYRETFMDEALATYFAHRLLNQDQGRNNPLLKYPKGFLWLPSIHREDYRFSSFYSTLRNGDLGPAVQEMDKYRHVGNLFSAAYDRGSKIIGIIEERLGEEAFLQFVRRIQKRYYFRVIHVQEFQKELEEFTGKSWDDFFKRWVQETGMTDWSLKSADVKRVTQSGVTENSDALYRVEVELVQRAQYTEATTLAFSSDGGKTYPVRVPIDPKAGSGAFDAPLGKIDVHDPKSARVTVYLPFQPDQITVDPDQVLPDTEPDNNSWKPQLRFRFTPFYSFLEETGFTTAYDRWNLIFGPWGFSPTWPDPWFTRQTLLGVRAGTFRTEEFQGGLYAGYRPNTRDFAVGFDGLLAHFPLKKTDLGFHFEKSIAQVTSSGTDLDQASVYTRYTFTESPSMYQPPVHHVETFASWQRNFLPDPRVDRPGSLKFNQLTTTGVHYHLDMLTPFWDPEFGFRFDASYAAGLPVFGQDHFFHQLTGQLSFVHAPPEGYGWFSQTRFAARIYGGWASLKDAKLLPLGGNLLFRGYDLAERQGSAAWVGSVEWRMPIWRNAEVEALDRFLRMKNVYIAPFYDIGDVSLGGKSLGPVSHAVGLGLRADVAWFSFLERTMMRFDVAQTIGRNTPTQFWFGIQHPF